MCSHVDTFNCALPNDHTANLCSSNAQRVGEGMGSQQLIFTPGAPYQVAPALKKIGTLKTLDLIQQDLIEYLSEGKTC